LFQQFTTVIVLDEQMRQDNDILGAKDKMNCWFDFMIESFGEGHPCTFEMKAMLGECYGNLAVHGKFLGCYDLEALSEAEKLTTDRSIKRFLAPAGLTGLWQVTKRGQSNVTEQERVDLDNEYAEKFSFMMDMKIILLTIPAMVQKESQ
jgi:hypothetical protein